MPRTRSETTTKKAEYAQKLVDKDPDVTQRDLADKIVAKFGTGLNFQIISNIKAGKDPFGKRRKKKAKGKAQKASKRRAAKRRGRKKKPVVTGSTYLITVVGNGTMVPAETKAEVKAEVARLVDGGVDPEEIVVYGRESVTVEMRSVVRF